VIPIQKFDEDYQKNQYYKTMGAKFNLPKIERSWYEFYYKFIGKIFKKWLRAIGIS
jgi:hypothetical protein